MAKRKNLRAATTEERAAVASEERAAETSEETAAGKSGKVEGLLTQKKKRPSSERKKAYSSKIEDYRLTEVIKKSDTSEVHKAIYLCNGETVAIKKMNPQSNYGLDDLMQAAQNLVYIDHTRLLKAHCYFSTDVLWIVMPFMENSSCKNLIDRTGCLEENHIRFILKQTLRGLDHLHKHDKIHGDVKASNILFDAKGGVKIAGMNLYGDKDAQHWLAPKMLQHIQCDIWAFGVTILELAFGNMLNSEGLQLVVDRATTTFSPDLKEVMESCLFKTNQTSSNSLLKLRFFKDVKKDVKSPKEELLLLLKAKKTQFSIGCFDIDFLVRYKSDVSTWTLSDEVEDEEKAEDEEKVEGEEKDENEEKDEETTINLLYLSMNIRTSLKIHPHATVFQVKMLIEEEVEVPANEQSLTYNSRFLEDTKEIAYYNLEEGDILLLGRKRHG